MGHDPEAGLEAERTATRQDSAVDSRGDVSGVQEIEAQEPRRAAPHLDGGYRAGGAEDRRASGEADEIGGVADQEAGHIGETAH
jgi:hypothetical protein